jgi:hypothetical protein
LGTQLILCLFTEDVTKLSGTSLVYKLMHFSIQGLSINEAERQNECKIVVNKQGSEQVRQASMEEKTDQHQSHGLSQLHTQFQLANS